GSAAAAPRALPARAAAAPRRPRRLQGHARGRPVRLRGGGRVELDRGARLPPAQEARRRRRRRRDPHGARRGVLHGGTPAGKRQGPSMPALRARRASLLLLAVVLAAGVSVSLRYRMGDSETANSLVRDHVQEVHDGLSVGSDGRLQLAIAGDVSFDYVVRDTAGAILFASPGAAGMRLV